MYIQRDKLTKLKVIPGHLLLWHIKHCRLFIAKSSLYIKYKRFGLVGFYDISIIVGYSMSNPLSTYILNIYDLLCLGFMACEPM